MSTENRKSKAKTESEDTPSCGRLSRRSFLSRLGATGAAATGDPFLGFAQTQLKQEPGSGCSAIGGFNRTLAILGTSEPEIDVTFLELS
jgi:hypothetical protein